LNCLCIRILYDGEKPPGPPVNPKNGKHRTEWGSTGKGARFLLKMQRLLGKMNDGDRQLLLDFAQKGNQRKKNTR
jgi:hypothetical protein